VRWLVLTHRYLGIGVGWLMLLWCLSGIVMIYSPFPRAEENRRVRSLAPLDWTRISPSKLGGFGGREGFSRFQLEMLADRAVLRLWAGEEPVRLTDAGTGLAIAHVSEDEAIAAATAYLGNYGHQIARASVDLISHDQWTVATATTDRPLYRVKMGDVARTEIYVSSRTGFVVQATSRKSRFWGCLGAIPHWLYPTVLRQRPQVWSQVVIWASIAAICLALSGLVVGVLALGRSAGPYGRTVCRGVLHWHHVSGLVFGALALSWVASGLLSMNPWGVLKGGDVERLPAGVNGDDVQTLLESLRERAPPSIQEITSAPLTGVFFAVATRTDGSRVRYDSSATVHPLSAGEIGAQVRSVAGADATWSMLRREDAYHYKLPEDQALLPVIRAESPGGDYYYLDPLSGAVVGRADSDYRSYRWWHNALHRLDFSPTLRSPTGRTVFLLPLLLGTTGLCGIGCFLALRRVLRLPGKKRKCL